MTRPVLAAPRLAARCLDAACRRPVAAAFRRPVGAGAAAGAAPARCLSLSAPLYKKAGKANKAHARSDSSPPVSQPGAPTPTDEALDVSGLERVVLESIEKLTHDLAQLRTGGRFNPELIDNLRVQLGTASTGKERVRLGDIAQVVPRGRMLQVVCGDEAHIKPVSTAIAASEHSLTPLAPDAANPLTIQVPLPPPTGDSRRLALDAAQKAADRADKLVQAARQDHNKLLRRYEVNKEVRPDDVQKAKKRMEDVIKKGHTEIKRITDGAKRVLDSQ
jgi:ribosome recycling factor